MGSSKRTLRDNSVFSAISSLHALYLATHLGPQIKSKVTEKLTDLCKHLKENPYEIPSFQIRDIPTPFGTGISPFEVIAASYVTQNF